MHRLRFSNTIAALKIMTPYRKIVKRFCFHILWKISLSEQDGTFKRKKIQEVDGAENLLPGYCT